jgi:hypothetical protein
LKAGDRIPLELLERPVRGVNLAPGKLRDQLGPDATLMVFLRHFGCVFCREVLSDLRSMVEGSPGFPRLLVLFQGNRTEGRAVLRKYWPELRAIADPTMEFYDGFGIQRGGVMQMFGPGVWAAKSRAAAKGHRNGERSGDIWRMPGALLTREDQILWAHEYRHAGDRPDYQLICDLAESAV